jgi:hypothetical protein
MKHIPRNAMLEGVGDDPLNELGYNKAIMDLLADLGGLNPELGPIELCCMWFDDFYFPGQSRPSQYPIDTWERGQREWKSCFTEHELRVLATFHEVFASEIDELPVTGKWQEDPGWQRVSTASRSALAQL